jgi:hypothetical protein
MGVARLVLGSVAACGTQSGTPLDASAGATSEEVLPLVDAPTDGLRSNDAGEGDAGGDGDALSNCMPSGDGAVPPFVPPNQPRSVCTSAQILALYNDCFASGASAACDAFYGDPANSPCIRCMLSKPTDPSWGAIVQYATDFTSLPNISGCIALVDQDAGPDGCAAACQALSVCGQNSCANMCPGGGTSAGLAVLDQCALQSQVTICAQYAQAVQCAQQPAYDGCVFADFESSFRGLGEFFCAHGSDGGTAEGGSDASGQ